MKLRLLLALIFLLSLLLNTSNSLETNNNNNSTNIIVSNKNETTITTFSNTNKTTTTIISTQNTNINENLTTTTTTNNDFVTTTTTTITTITGESLYNEIETNNNNETLFSYKNHLVNDNDYSIVNINYSDFGETMSEETAETTTLLQKIEDTNQQQQQFDDEIYEIEQQQQANSNLLHSSNITLLSRKSYNSPTITSTNISKLNEFGLKKRKSKTRKNKQNLSALANTILSTFKPNNTTSVNLNQITATTPRTKRVYESEYTTITAPIDDLETTIDSISSTTTSNETLSLNNSADSILRNQAAPSYQQFQSTNKISLIDFDFVVNEFVKFEPKDGYVDLNGKLKYKWWYKSNEFEDSDNRKANIEFEDESLPQMGTNGDMKQSKSASNTKSSSVYPFIDFKDKGVKFKIQNQIYQIDNVEEYYEKYEDLNRPQAQKLYSGEVLDDAADDESTSNYTSVRKMKRQFSYLEQNVTLKFRCSNGKEAFSPFEMEDREDKLDFSGFPFDVHKCVLEFDLLATQNYFSPNNKNGQDNVLYLFSSQKSSSQNEYFKLAKLTSNLSLTSYEWILKQATIKFFNATAATSQSNNQTNNTSTQLKPNVLIEEELSDEDSEVVDDYIMFLKNTGHFKKRNYDNIKSLQTKSVSPSKVSLEFLIYRRREPQIYLFVVPLIILTLITFLIFFLPTTSTDEKSLIALLNCAFLLIYNIYAFKLVVLTYELVKIPLILKYSNCLMIIQLGVLAYTCLVKSIYHNGFLTFSSRTYMDASEELYNQLTYMHSNQQNIIGLNSLPHQSEQKEHPTCVIRRGCVKMEVNQEVDSSTKYAMQGSEHINEQIESFGGQFHTATGTTDESNYTVYNNIDQICECSALETDADCINGTRDENFGDDEDNANSSTNKNDYGIISENNTNKGTSSQVPQEKSSAWLFEKFCCGNVEHLKCLESDKNIKSSCKTTITNGTLQQECDYASHLSRRKMPSLNQNGGKCFPPAPPIPNDSRNLSFVIKQNKSTGGATNKMSDQSILLFNSINFYLRQMIRFEEANIKEKLVKEEWKRKARFCDGICCLFIFFILITCSICIFAILPTIKITSMVD